MAAIKAHVYYCFNVLISYLEGKEPEKPNFENASYPLFVTWNIEKYGEKHLRGCIGNFSELPLRDGLRQYALTSALRDSRFSPIRLSEVPKLSCGVSLLVHFEEGQDYLDWEIGTHGIWIEFKHHGRTRTATYLPEVMPEQGWTKTEAIDSLLRKGGFSGLITEDVRKAIRLTRYQSSKVEATYDEYIQSLKE